MPRFLDPRIGEPLLRRLPVLSWPVLAGLEEPFALLGVHVLCQYQILGVGFLWVPSDIRRALTGPVRSLPSSGGIEAAADARALPDERHPSLRPSLHVPPLSFRSRLSEIGCGRAGDSISAGHPDTRARGTHQPSCGGLSPERARSGHGNPRCQQSDTRHVCGRLTCAAPREPMSSAQRAHIDDRQSSLKACDPEGALVVLDPKG